MIHRSYKTAYYSRMSFKKSIGLIALIVGLLGCAPTHQKGSSDKLQQGRNLYIKNCGSCHNLYLPSTYTSREWKPILDKMQKPARIDDAQKALIATYLNTNCKK